MGKQTVVRVNKVESYRDLNGSLGKKIELIEEHEDHSNALVPDEVKAMMAGVNLVLQQTMPQMQMQKPVMPKMILFLTEDEYDAIEVPLDVNQTYTLDFDAARIIFARKEAVQGP